MSGKTDLPLTISEAHLLQSLLLPWLPEAESLLPGLGAVHPRHPRGRGPPCPCSGYLGKHGLRVPGGVSRVLAAAPLHATVDSLHVVSVSDCRQPSSDNNCIVIFNCDKKETPPAPSALDPPKRAPGRGL